MGKIVEKILDFLNAFVSSITTDVPKRFIPAEEKDETIALVARSLEDLEYAYERLKNSRVFGVDTETNGFTPKTCELLSVQISDGKFSCLVPISEGVELGPLSVLLESTNYIKVLHNARFDLRFLNHYGYTVNRVWDSMVAEKLILKQQGVKESAALAATLLRYYNVELDKTLREVFIDPNWDGIWDDALLDYAMSDVVLLPTLFFLQHELLHESDLLEEFTLKCRSLQKTISV